MIQPTLLATAPGHGASALGRNAGALRLATRAAGIVGSPIDSSIGLLQRQTHPVVSFAMGCPGAEALPSAALDAIARELFGEDGAGLLSYGPTEGERSLRAALLDLIPTMLGQNVSPDELLVTAGGMQGLDLVCKLLLDPGDLVAVEEPLYANTAMVIRSYEGRLLPVPVDAQGMRVELLPDLIAAAGRAPRVINVIPNFQNPTGVTLSLERRRLLLDIAARHDSFILDDDPYGLLHFGEACPPSLRALSGNDPRVIGVHTFSKILAPGLRVGWVVAAPGLISRMVDAKQGMDTCTNVLGQRLAAEFCRRGLAEHLRLLRRLYAARHDAMIAALGRAFQGVNDVAWSEPGGGFFLWLTLPRHIDAARLFPRALAAGVAFVPGAAFSNQGGFGNAARLCFAYPTIPEIGLGIERLRATIDDCTSETSS